MRDLRPARIRKTNIVGLLRRVSRAQPLLDHCDDPRRRGAWSRSPEFLADSCDVRSGRESVAGRDEFQQFIEAPRAPSGDILVKRVEKSPVLALIFLLIERVEDCASIRVEDPVVM